MSININSNMNINSDMLKSQVAMNKEEGRISDFKKIMEDVVEGKKDEKLKEASEEFEIYFLQMMMKEMRKTVNKDDSFIKESNAEKIFREELDNQMMIELGKTGQLGLAKSIYERLIIENE